jgi:dTDP-4-amino-4,6-dideoxygalactose transaminase
MEMAKRIFSLPMHPYLVEKDVRVISDTIATILK